MSDNDITEGEGLVLDVVSEVDYERGVRDLVIGLALAAAGFFVVGGIFFYIVRRVVF